MKYLLLLVAIIFSEAQGFQAGKARKYFSDKKCNPYISAKLQASSESTNVISTSEGLMISSLKLNLKGIGMPRVIPPGKKEEEWLMWFHGRDFDMARKKTDLLELSTGRVYFATSKDGLSGWTLHPDGPCLSPSGESGDWWYFDSEHVGLGDVIQPGRKAQSKFVTQDGVFLMYIFGGDSTAMVVGQPGLEGSKSVKGMKMEIGVAVSQDGAHWSRVEGPGPYGAILEIGKSGEFDSQFVGWPKVLEVGSEYNMYYHTYDVKTKKFLIAYATSSDGLRWSKRGPVFKGGDQGAFDEMGASRRHVARVSDGSFKMWYEGLSRDGRHSIGLALSKDGIRWERLREEPVFTANSDTDEWDSGGVGSPHLIWMETEKKWRMYYVGTKTNTDPNADPALFTGIGVAESTDEEGIYFERIKV